MPLIDSDRYDEIRAVLDVSLDKSNLPDSIIEKDIFVGEAERWVAALTSSTGAAAKNAVIYYTASLLAPSIPTLVAQKESTGESVTFKAIDWDAKSEALLARANYQILQANNAEGGTLSDRPTTFTVAHGRRHNYGGRW